MIQYHISTQCTLLWICFFMSALSSATTPSRLTSSAISSCCCYFPQLSAVVTPASKYSYFFSQSAVADEGSSSSLIADVVKTGYEETSGYQPCHRFFWATAYTWVPFSGFLSQVKWSSGQDTYFPSELQLPDFIKQSAFKWSIIIKGVL